MAHEAFHQSADNPQAPHIHEDVQRTDVEKEMRHQSPPLAAKRARPVIGAPRDARSMFPPHKQRSDPEGLCQVDDTQAAIRLTVTSGQCDFTLDWSSARCWPAASVICCGMPSRSQLVDLVQVVDAGRKSDMTSARREERRHLLAGRVRFDPADVEEREVDQA